jgi:RimJ/RimL family protein N-acetyltransferase
MPRSLTDLDWPVRTERLLIRPATTDDAERTWAYRRLDEVSQWLSGGDPGREEYIARFTEPGYLASALILEREDAAGTVLIGDLKLAVEDGWAQREVAERAVGVQAELGWVLDPAHRGRGYAVEAVTALLGISFDRMGLRRIVAYCFADNEASWRLMERIGLRREMHTVADSLHRSGAWLDGLGYALLADEWRARTDRRPSA